MKSIKYFGKKTLESLTISLNYEENLPGIELEKIFPFAKSIEASYPIKPKIGLLKRRFSTIELVPFTFWDENKKNRVEFGQDFLVFTFLEYSKWDRELPKVLSVFQALGENLDLPKISKIVMTYVDKFTILREGFQYNKYFTMPNFDFEHEWEIKFHDTNLGFVPFEESSEIMKKKIVLRFKSLQPNHDEEFFNFKLESVGSADEFSMEPQTDILESHLNDCHDRIEEYFINFLTEEYRKELELEINGE